MSRNVVITGANAGIGLETAVALAVRGDRVVIACRNPDKTAEAIDEIERRTGVRVESVPLDLASFESIRACAKELADRTPKLDVLVNNAGLILSKRTTTVEGFETMFGVNHLGHFLLTTLLRDQLLAAGSPRVVNVSSMAHMGAVGGLRFDDLQTAKRFNGWLVYARSKLANIYFTQELARRWGGEGLISHSLHPGAVQSRFGRDGDTAGVSALMIRAGEMINITQEEGAKTSVFLATAPEAADTNGGYWYKCKPARLAPWGNRPADARRLWDVSERYVADGHP